MLSDEIKNLKLEGDVEDASATLEKYATDASIFYVKPSLVVFPKNSDDIKKLVKFVAEQKTLRLSSGQATGRNLSLTARAAGTDMSGGPLTESIVVEFTRYFNHFLELGSDYAIVEPGMYYRDFEKQTLTRNLLLPSFPSSRELCAMGGIVNNNSGGEKTLRYGKTERYVDSITMILADGNEYEFSKLTKEQLDQKMALQTFEGQVYRDLFKLINDNYDVIKQAKPDVTKNSAGYYLWNVYDKQTGTFDIAKLMCGAQGTLGLMTKVKLKLVRPNTSSKLLTIFINDLSLIAHISSIVVPLNPESFEMYDDKTFKLAIKYWPEIFGYIKASMVKIILKTFPEFWLVMTGGIPKLVLLAEFTANSDKEAEALATAAKEALHKSLGHDIKLRITSSKEEQSEFWVVRRQSFNLLRKHTKDMRTAPFIDDFSVKVEKLPTFLPKLYEILGHYKIIYTLAGHVGDGNFHIIPLMDLTKPVSKEIIKNLSSEVFDLVIRFGGTIDSEHNDGIVRTPYLSRMYGGDIYNLFIKTKQIFDPLNMFNPGKKVPSSAKAMAGEGGTLEYAQSHINIHQVGATETKKQAS